MKITVTAVDLARATWRKSSFSGDGNSNCVEIAETGRAIAVRDSKDPDGPALVIGPQAWGRFAARVKGGHLDPA
jgi:hypothetical protein